MPLRVIDMQAQAASFQLNTEGLKHLPAIIVWPGEDK